jgi:hypothetical protein
MVKWVKKEGKNENPTLQEASSSSLVKHGLHHERHAPSCNLGKSFFAPMASSISKRQTLLGKPKLCCSLRKRKKKS